MSTLTKTHTSHSFGRLLVEFPWVGHSGPVTRLWPEPRLQSHMVLLSVCSPHTDILPLKNNTDVWVLLDKADQAPLVNPLLTVQQAAILTAGARMTGLWVTWLDLGSEMFTGSLVTGCLRLLGVNWATQTEVSAYVLTLMKYLMMTD